MRGGGLAARRAAVLVLAAPLVAMLGWLGGVRAAPPVRPARKASTALVFPQPHRALRFSHAKHAGFSCAQCHPRAKTSVRSSDKLRPGKAACVSCHPEATPTKPSGRSGGLRRRRTCAKCHRQIDARGVPRMGRWPRPRVRFSHKLHADRGVACQRCHAGVARAGFASPTHLPAMRVCLGCHTGRPKEAPRRCATCHARLPGGRVRTHYPEGVLRPGPSLPSLDHGPTFRRHHGAAARSHRRTCESCHARATCLRCHGGLRRPASIHVGDYIHRHGREARANRQRCKACHTRQRFCLSCHQRMGVARSNAASPYRTPGLQHFHGPNWASSTAKGVAFNRHAIHARRSVGTCVSCHRERDCMRCHARRRVGGLGRSPHGPGFRGSRRCRVMLRRNQRACLKCHGYRDPLMSLCR